MMSLFQVVADPSLGSSVGIMETSNFAHVIFQSVSKSFLPQAPLECHYTLTPHLTPHPKDWVGIFKVGWSTARDYYTFLWSPMPESYEPGSTVHRTVVFQGYYVPRSDGEFYQFCYVSHGGDIRGASTPFLFRSATPTDDLLTVAEDDSNSDILVVTTKAGLQEREQEAQQERRELLAAMRLLQEERQQLLEEQKRLAREREQERESCCLLRSHNQELLRSSQGLSEEREEVRRRLAEAMDRSRQLEEDLREATQRGLQRETELDCLRERLKKVSSERDTVEAQLKNEKEERDLFKAHQRSSELENTKLSAELQMLKAVELNREVTIAQFQEELQRLRACVAQRDGLEKELLHHQAGKVELSRMREQLRQTEEQLQSIRQQAVLMASARDRGTAELRRARLDADQLRASLQGAQEECRRMEGQLDHLRTSAHREVGVGTGAEPVVSETEAELQREVEELKLRLHMAAEHYKDKYRECQRLRRQVAKMGEPKRNAATDKQDTTVPSPESPTAGNLCAVVLQQDDRNTHLEMCTDAHTETHTLPGGGDGREEKEEDSLRMTSWVEVKNEEEEKEKDRSEDEEEESVEEVEEEESVEEEQQEEVEEEEESVEEVDEEEESVEEEEESVEENDEEEESVEEEPGRGAQEVQRELETMEEKWREQVEINETLRRRLSDEEDHFKVQMSQRTSEVQELQMRLAQALQDKLQLQEELQHCVSRHRVQEEQRAQEEVLGSRQPVVLRYPLPYPQDPSPPPLVPQKPAELQFGNPYSTGSTRDRADGSLSPDQMPRPPAEAPSPCAPPCAPLAAGSPQPSPGAVGGAVGVVCIQPSRSMSPPDGLEHPPEEPRNVGDGGQPCDHQTRPNEPRSTFCFDSSEAQRRCPLCEVIFPPHFEQSSFQQHVESHWKVCPVCGEHFPLSCQQTLFERHVMTHFDGHVLNFHQIE